MARPPRSADDANKSGPQRLVALVRSSVPPMHPAGLPFVSAGLAVAALGRRNRWLRRAGLAVAGANAAFFRHPPRTPPSRPGVVVAPADGLVCLVEEAEPPAELDLHTGPLPRVSIFLSILDAHVQRAPIGGDVVAVSYRAGRFHSADLAAASADNERNSVLIRTPEGQEVVAVQIAGLIARRIVCHAREGQHLATGERFGLIRFGSRTDLFLPKGVSPLVAVGQRMIGGETVMADLASTEGPRRGEER